MTTEHYTQCRQNPPELRAPDSNPGLLSVKLGLTEQLLGPGQCAEVAEEAAERNQSWGELCGPQGPGNGSARRRVLRCTSEGRAGISPLHGLPQATRPYSRPNSLSQCPPPSHPSLPTPGFPHYLSLFSSGTYQKDVCAFWFDVNPSLLYHSCDKGEHSILWISKP